MNPHVQAGNEALGRGDHDTANEEFLKALDDPDPLVQRIARNRLYELNPEQVYASTHSYQGLYHRRNCPAKNVIWNSHIIWYRDWREAEECGRQPCSMCRPARVIPFTGQPTVNVVETF